VTCSTKRQSIYQRLGLVNHAAAFRTYTSFNSFAPSQILPISLWLQESTDTQIESKTWHFRRIHHFISCKLPSSNDQSDNGTRDHLIIRDLPYPPLDNIQVMVIVWRLRGNIIRTAPCWVVWHNVYSQQHTHVSSPYRSSRLGSSHWDSTPCIEAVA